MDVAQLVEHVAQLVEHVAQPLERMAQLSWLSMWLSCLSA